MPLNYKNLFQMLLLIALGMSCKNEQKTLPKEAVKPNIIFIVADDLGWADLHCYGANAHKTPYLDQMAKEGVRFTNAYAAAPVCSPTRASILTGKYPATLNLTDFIPGRQNRMGLESDKKLKTPEFEQQLKLDEFTIAEALKRQGYATVSIGKWHLGDSLYYPTAQGFYSNIGGNHRGYPPTYYYPYKKVNPNDGTVFELVDVKEKAKKGEYLTDALTSIALNFMEENKEKPFFIYLPYYAVHAPIEGKKELLKKYEGEMAKDSLKKKFNANYAAMIETLDFNVGRILNQIERLDIAKNTLVVFVSDNGGLTVSDGKGTPATTNYPLREGKGHLYEGGIRVPMIMQWEGQIKKGLEIDYPVNTVDLFPTINEILNFNSDLNFDGLSLLSLIKGDDDKSIAERAMYWHYPHYSNQGNKPSSAVRLDKYKLIEFYEDNHKELYNLKNDISEKVNLIDSLPNIAKDLNARLMDWKNKVDAKLPISNPIYENGKK